MRMRDGWFGTLVAVLGFVPIGTAYASADCQAVAAEALVAPLPMLGKEPSWLDSGDALVGENLATTKTRTTAFHFQLMSPLLDTGPPDWQMPAGRYWFSVELGEARVTQEGIGIPADDIESWLLAPVESLAVPF